MFIPSHRLIVSPGKERVEQWDSVVPALEKQTPAVSAYHAVLSERAIKWLRVSTRGDTFTSTTKAIDIRHPAILDEHFDGRERMRRPQRSNLWLATRIPHVLTTLLPPRGGFHVGVANGLPPRGIAVLLFFPILAIAGYVAVLGRLPGKLDGPRYLVKAIVHAAIVAGRHWRLAPIPCSGAAAVATVFDAIPVATALAVVAAGLALLGIILTTARTRNE